MGSTVAGKQNPKIVEALRLVDAEGMNINAAAGQMGIPATSLYSAYQRRKLKILESREAGVCEKCGAPVDAQGRYTTVSTRSISPENEKKTPA